MAKQELTWVNVKYDQLQGEPKAAHEALVKARLAFRAAMEKAARKAGKLEKGERLVLNFKAWGFGMAVAKDTSNSSSNASDSDMFASL